MGSVGTRRGNPISPNLISPAERLAEVAETLALGILRLRTETLATNSADSGDELVDFSRAESGREPRRKAVGRRT